MSEQDNQSHSHILDEGLLVAWTLVTHWSGQAVSQFERCFGGVDNIEYLNRNRTFRIT